MATMSTLIDKVLIRLSAASGIDAQTYAEERVMMAIQHKFDALFDDMWWPQFLETDELMTLTGTTGVVTINLSTKIKKFGDIRNIWLSGQTAPLPVMNEFINPATVKSACYTSVKNMTKVFKIVPETTTGNIRVAYATRPDTFIEGSEVDMDEQCMILGTCYDILEDEGSNPANADKFKSMFDARYRQLKIRINARPRAMSNIKASNSYPAEWY